MEIYRLDSSNYKIFNQSSSETIVDEECDDNAKSLIAYWLDDSIESPIIKNETLKTGWEAFVIKFKQDDGNFLYWEDLITFLEEYNSPEWIGYEITSYGIACGPVSYTVVYVVDKDVIVEELDEDEMLKKMITTSTD